ncbi:MAG: hypothetical protein GXP47_11730 [Acidobacteria bacterium]|nr:hypothetical protein [Acidobacteriota bacterium]
MDNRRAIGPVPLVTDDGGHVIELDLSEAPTMPLGGLLALNGKRVVVWGDLVQASPSVLSANRLDVTSIVLEGGEQPRAPATVSGSQPWVSVLCKFSDIADEPRDLAYFRNMFSSNYPGLDHYWREVSYNNIDVLGSGAHGWYTLPYPKSHYVDSSGNADLNALFTDCTLAADVEVYYPSFVGINLMFNSTIGNYAWGGNHWANLDGVTKSWRTTWEPPWGYENVCVMSHEMGHGFGLPHSCFNPSTGYDNAWDVMSDTWSFTTMDPVYGHMGQHTIVYHKDVLLGWLQESDRVQIPVGNSDTVTLERMAQPTNRHPKSLRVPIAGSTTHFYTAESRMRAGYDIGTPGDAVIIHEVDTTRSMPAFVQGSDGAYGAMWTVGKVFRDTANDIGIAVVGKTQTGFTVAVANGSDMAASGLDVDSNDASGTVSNVNGILEPGETVLLDPAWTNVFTSPLNSTGTLADFTGPSGATYTIVDGAADYGSFSPAEVADCLATGDCYRITVSNPASRPVLHWDATVTEALSSGATRIWTLHIGNSFNDVPTSRWEYSAIETLYHHGLTAGCGSGNFCPDVEINRQEMAVQILRAMGVVDQPVWENIFSDMPACDPDPAVFCWSRWAEELFRQGISAGCSYNPATGERRFCPLKTLPRREMAVQILRALGATDQPIWEDIFSDMPACDPDPGVFCWSRWAEEYFRKGITAGCYYNPTTGERRFCPQGPVPRSHMAVFLVRAFDLTLYGP